MASGDEFNPDLSPEQIYYNYAVPLPPSTTSFTFTGDINTVVTSINGAVGPAITLATSVGGLSFQTSGSTITLQGAVTQIQESSGPTILDIGAINNNEFLIRSGTDIISSPAVTPPLDVTTITFADTPYSLTDANDMILVNATGGVVNVNLPNGTTAFKKVYYIKKIDASVNNVDINGTGGDVIDGAGTQSLTTQWESVGIVPDGDWFIV